MSDTITSLDDLCKYFGLKAAGFLAPEVLEPRLARILYDRDNGHLRMRLLGAEGEVFPSKGIAIGDPEHSGERPSELYYPFATATIDTLIDTMIAQGRANGPYTWPTLRSVEDLTRYLKIEGSDAESVERELNKRGFTRVNFRWTWDDSIPADVLGVHLGSKVEPDAQGDLLFPFNVRFMDDVLIRIQTGK